VTNWLKITCFSYPSLIRRPGLLRVHCGTSPWS